MTHPAFSLANPNRVRSLIGAFASGNQTQFNAADGRGYRFRRRHRLDARREEPAGGGAAARRLQELAVAGAEPARPAEAALRRVAARGGLSADVRDIVDRSLG